MKVLIITKAPWDDRLASGNTLSNLFSEWPDTQYACIYCRDAVPNNCCCNSYLSISPLQVARNLFTPGKIGRVIKTSDIAPTVDNSTEDKLVGKSKSNRSLSYLINELIYATGNWLNKKCKSFIDDFRPDVVFCFGVPDPVNYGILKYVKKHSDAVVVSYYVDDLYNEKNKSAILRCIERNRLRKIAALSDKCYGISQLMCDEYSKLYGKDFSLLFKGCEISEPKDSYNNPISFVYAGNLLYNRNKSLEALARAIELVNAGSPKAFLNIYSGTKVSDDVRKSLNIEGSSRLNGLKPFSEIKEIMHSCDIVLHVESFDRKQMDLVRLSFSTKITDCMQSGSVMMAIGPAGIASIEYPKNSIPGAIVVNSLDELPNVIGSIVESPEQLNTRAEAMNQFAKEAAEISKVRNRLRTDFVELLNTKK